MLRARLEELIGRSLSDIRIYRDADAHDASVALGARAFTIGRDIFFRQRTYDPTSTEGLRLIVHEVAHTQQAAPATRRSCVGPPTAIPQGGQTVNDIGIVMHMRGAGRGRRGTRGASISSRRCSMRCTA